MHAIFAAKMDWCLEVWHDLMSLAKLGMRSDIECDLGSALAWSIHKIITWWSRNQKLCPRYQMKHDIMNFNFYVEHLNWIILDHWEICPIKLDFVAEKHLENFWSFYPFSQLCHHNLAWSSNEIWDSYGFKLFTKV